MTDTSSESARMLRAKAEKNKANRSTEVEPQQQARVYTSLNKLTGLPDKYEQLKSCVDKIQNQRGLVPIIVALDMDNLKGLNDVVGHDGADIVIKMVGRCLWRFFADWEKNHGSDFHERGGGATCELFHRSGDEFTVVFANCTMDAAEECMRLARDALAYCNMDTLGYQPKDWRDVLGQPADGRYGIFVAAGNYGKVTVSSGLAAYDEELDNKAGKAKEKQEYELEMFNAPSRDAPEWREFVTGDATDILPRQPETDAKEDADPLDEFKKPVGKWYKRAEDGQELGKDLGRNEVRRWVPEELRDDAAMRMCVSIALYDGMEKVVACMRDGADLNHIVKIPKCVEYVEARRANDRVKMQEIVGRVGEGFKGPPLFWALHFRYMAPARYLAVRRFNPNVENSIKGGAAHMLEVAMTQILPEDIVFDIAVTRGCSRTAKPAIDVGSSSLVQTALDMGYLRVASLLLAGGAPPQDVFKMQDWPPLDPPDQRPPPRYDPPEVPEPDTDVATTAAPKRGRKTTNAKGKVAAHLKTFEDSVDAQEAERDIRRGQSGTTEHRNANQSARQQQRARRPAREPLRPPTEEWGDDRLGRWFAAVSRPWRADWATVVRPALSGMLQEVPALLNMYDDDGRTALHWAVIHKNMGLLQWLFGEDPADHPDQLFVPQVVKVGGDVGGDAEEQKERVELTDIPRVNIEAYTHARRTPLYLACKWHNGNMEQGHHVVQFLLLHGADVAGRKGTGKTCLHEACANRNLPLIELLLDDRFSGRIHMYDQAHPGESRSEEARHEERVTGVTPLEMAARERSLRSVNDRFRVNDSLDEIHEAFRLAARGLSQAIATRKDRPVPLLRVRYYAAVDHAKEEHEAMHGGWTEGDEDGDDDDDEYVLDEELERLLEGHPALLEQKELLRQRRRLRMRARRAQKLVNRAFAVAHAAEALPPVRMPRGCDPQLCSDNIRLRAQVSCVARQVDAARWLCA